MSHDVKWVLRFAFLALLGIALGIMLGARVVGESYERAAIEHGCASYDPTTGEWGWLPAVPPQ